MVLFYYLVPLLLFFFTRFIRIFSFFFLTKCAYMYSKASDYYIAFVHETSQYKGNIQVVSYCMN